MYILVCNVGSTSLKFKLYNMPSAEALAEGKIERVGSRDDAVFHYKNCQSGFSVTLDKQCIPTYTEGIEKYLSYLTDKETGALEDLKVLERIGFKTVLAKGYYGVHLLNEPVMAAMREYLPIAPVHNACYLEAIGQFQKILPDKQLIGVFETAFHVTIPKERRLYAIPYEWYEKYGIQRLGYHGASHGYIAERIGSIYGPAQKIISCHLGGSCSICAILDGQSIDNSFGFTPQTGVMHADRVGDADSYIVPFLMTQGMPMEEILAGLDKKGGLKGVSGVSNDIRYLREAADKGDERSKLAIAMLVDAIVRYIGSYYAFLGGLDHIVFTGGIGENDSRLRADVCEKIPHLGVALDGEINRTGEAERLVSSEGSLVKVHVIPANEELVVARETYKYN